jgi:Holliday junction resolvase-like predicted endonuclease
VSSFPVYPPCAITENVLDENEVVDAVCIYLEATDHKIIQRCTTNDKGIDIIATLPSGSGRLLVEAKGGKSSKPGSPRFGETYRKPEVFDRVAKGFYTAASMSASRLKEDEVALAYPDTPWFREYLLAVKPALELLSIAVYMVREDKKVCTL